jgi:hypothetical protein
MTDSEYINVIHRELPYSTFDADNHLYENREALTKFLPPEYDGLIKYVDVNGRTKLAIREKISDYIPNPTFGKVAVPGGAGYDITKGGQGFGNRAQGFGKMVAMPGVDAFFDPEPRLELMKEMGIDRTLLWPTLASAIEERLADDPDAVCAVVHALNEWMHEHWTYVYSGSIYSTPIISLAVLERAMEELELINERGAKIFLVRVAPVPTWKGRKSFALPEFDPFWQRVQELDLTVGMHSGDPGYTRYTNEWEGFGDREMSISRHARRASPAFLALSSEKDTWSTPWRRSSATAWRPGSRSSGSYPSSSRAPGSAPSTRSCSGPTKPRPCSSTRTRSRCSSATCGSTPSTSLTREA